MCNTMGINNGDLHLISDGNYVILDIYMSWLQGGKPLELNVYSDKLE